MTTTNDKPPRNRGTGKPFTKGNPGRPKLWTKEIVLPALIAARGNYTKAARLLGEKHEGLTCHRDTIRRLVQKHPELRRRCEEAWISSLESMHDQMTESALRGDQRAQALILTRFHPGYRHKQEISGPGGGPLHIAAQPPAHSEVDKLLEGVELKMLSHGEQIELSSLVYVQVKHPPLSTEQAARLAALIDKARDRKQIELRADDADRT